MAKVSAHGSIVGTVEYLTTAKRYMSDGTILKNQGFGWKLAGKVTTTPESAFDAAKESVARQRQEKPFAAAYMDQLHDLAGMGKRWKLHQAVRMMPDDCDGVWSEVCDGFGDNIIADVDDIARLCAAYRLTVRSKES